MNATDSDDSPLKIYSASEKDFELNETANGSAFQAAMLPGPGIVPGWGAGGIVRWEKGKTQLVDWTFFYTEVLYMISGRGKITASSPPFLSPQSYEVGPGEVVFIPIGMRGSFEAVSDEPWVFFYAVPA
jgi:oxalate decarboxylase/phosphoglucose isomerase-like protein (cupin superfamily)